MMRTAVRSLPPEKSTAKLVVLPMFEDKERFRAAATRLQRLAGIMPPQVTSKVFTGKRGQTVLVPSTRRNEQLILGLGMGTVTALTREVLRKTGAAAVSSAISVKAGTIACVEPGSELEGGELPAEALTTEEIAQSLAEGALLAAYRFDKYQTRNADERFAPAEFMMLAASAGRAAALARGAECAGKVCAGVFLARDLANIPGNDLFPDVLAREARALGRHPRVTVTVFDEKKIARLGMGGLMGVAQGSAHAPRFIILEYTPRKTPKKARTVVLVGKGVTFDSGGISIKPSANMGEMKMDMSGAAAVLGTIQVASAQHLPVHLVGLIPAAENLPGSRALKPGDILKHLNGMTSEIENTDAEGRLILADALVYAGRFSPDLVIDLATLTGAVVVALGHFTTGMLGTADDAMRQMEEAGRRTYERVWQLPLFEEYERLIKSDVADVRNTGGRWAGAITAALFLKKFTGTYPWVHLDIAGTAIVEEPSEYIQKGGSGVGVRLLVDFLHHWNNQ
jgi:leucyl aminopeptidase